MKTKAVRSDDQDTFHKVNMVRGAAYKDAELSHKMAQAISKDVTLLDGLAPVIRGLAQHEGSRKILIEVFQMKGVAKRYPHTHRAFIEAIL